MKGARALLSQAMKHMEVLIKTVIPLPNPSLQLDGRMFGCWKALMFHCARTDVSLCSPEAGTCFTWYCLPFSSFGVYTCSRKYHKGCLEFIWKKRMQEPERNLREKYISTAEARHSRSLSTGTVTQVRSRFLRRFVQGWAAGKKYSSRSPQSWIDFKRFGLCSLPPCPGARLISTKLIESPYKDTAQGGAYEKPPC